MPCVAGCIFFISLSSILILAASMAVDVDQKEINIAAIINSYSETGRQQKTAMEIALEDFNNKSNGHHKLSIFFRNTNGDPLQSALSAEELIQKQQAHVIIGTETWQEATLVSDTARKFRVPFLVLATPSISPPFTSPYVFQMAKSESDQVACLVSIISLHRWKRVVVIREDEPYGSDSGAFFLLSNSLQEVGIKIDYSISLPSSVSQKTVQKELRSFVNKHYHSMVFVVLRLSSTTVATHLFEGARQMGLSGEESVWLITEQVTDQVQLLLNNKSGTLVSAQGALGIQAPYSKSSDSFQEFEARFWLKSANSEPGFNALLAYDGIMAIVAAMERSSKTFLSQIQTTTLTGLTGEIQFHQNKLSDPREYNIMNVAHEKLAKVDTWTSVAGFSSTGNDHVKGEEAFAPGITWPGNLSRIPKGWAMPSKEKPMRIGVPDDHAFKNFVHHVQGHNYSGFCIELFKKAVEILGYNLSHVFIPRNDTYESLIDQIYTNKLDAAVGDLTALENRTDYVDFTQPYAESGLAMILPVDNDNSNKGWIFLKPFRKELWLVTFGIMIYTMIVIWFLEHQNNPEFRGSWKDQLSTAVGFTLSTLFFSQRENIRSNYTRAVVIVWLFVVLVLTQSYTAYLSSMLTVARLNQNQTDFETLVLKKAKVGCHADSFVKDFLQRVLKFDKVNIIPIQTKLEYFHDNFTAGKIQAAFLEIPYANLFQAMYCNKYTITLPGYSFGGLTFAFAQGSPIGVDISRAMLNLTETGHLRTLEETWLNATSTCLDENSQSQSETESLGLEGFWGLFLLSAATSTLCLIGSILHRYR